MNSITQETIEWAKPILEKIKEYTQERWYIFADYFDIVNFRTLINSDNMFLIQEDTDGRCCYTLICNSNNFNNKFVKAYWTSTRPVRHQGIRTIILAYLAIIKKANE